MPRTKRFRKVAKDSVPIETYPKYLRRVGADYKESGSEFTAQDYDESAQLIEDMYTLIKNLCINSLTIEEYAVAKALIKRVTR